MLEQSSYDITINDQEITIKLNRELIDQETLNNLLDYLKLESIRNKSQLTEELAQQLADEIDAKIWQKLQSKYDLRKKSIDGVGASLAPLHIGLLFLQHINSIKSKFLKK